MTLTTPALDNTVQVTLTGEPVKRTEGGEVAMMGEQSPGALSPRTVSLRVRRRYFDEIKARRKLKELRRDSEHWRKRLLGKRTPKIAVFVCGKDSYRCWILAIERKRTPRESFSAQGKKDVDTPTCFVLHLGEEVK